MRNLYFSGNSEEESVTDKDLSGSDDNQPRKRGAYGNTGIPSFESIPHKSLDKKTIEDQESWESGRLESCISKVVISRDTQHTNDRTKVDIPGSSLDLLKGTIPYDQSLDEHTIAGSDQESTNLCSRGGSFTYSEDFVSLESERSGSESSISVGSVLKTNS
mgnify:CR=1 FL=1